MTTVIPADTRTAHWGKPNGWGCFQPTGRRSYHGNRDYLSNPKNWSDTEGRTLVARLFVGFNVGKKTVYKMRDLVKIVRRVRKDQTGDPSSTFVSQHGIYRHKTGEVVEEPGAQVIIINTGGVSAKRFNKQMAKLAETIASKMKQEEVVVEIQRGGLVQEVFGVEA